MKTGLQTTLKDSVQITGIGLHSGKTVRITIRPAPVGYGIQFMRTDLAERPTIEATFENVVNTQMATTLGCGKVTIGTVEHLMAALAGLQIDSALIEIDGPEVPVLDGSSAEFVHRILDVGVATQLKARATVKIKRTIELQLEDKWAVVEPSDRLEIHSTVLWNHPSIGHQEFSYIEGETDFSEIASARTFGFLRDVEALKRMGLARGGSFDNAIVLDDEKVLNPDGLRFADEFVRHKVLDSLGDFKLAGLSIQGCFNLHKSGHDLHRKLLGAVFSNPENYEVLDVQPKKKTETRRPALVRVAGRFVNAF